MTVTIGPTSDRDYENKKTLTSYLAKQLVQGKMALVLGAGISQPLGLPGWKKLIRRMYRQKGSRPPKGMTPEDLAGHFLDQRCKGDKKKFLDAVSKALYGGVDLSFENLKTNMTLEAIGSLVMASRRGSSSEVITFNFDDVLELFLEYHGFVVDSIVDEKYWRRNSDVTVYHPHGLLPSTKAHEGSQWIVFDRKSYSLDLREDKPWNQQILTTMRTHSCVFIGVSGDDDKLDWFLNRCNDTHASRLEGTKYWGITFMTDAKSPKKEKWKQRGVYPKVVVDYTTDLPKFLFGVCQTAATTYYGQ